jgi:hypothetical protein
MLTYIFMCVMLLQLTGTAELRDKAKTPLDTQQPSRSREVIELPGELHDLLRNCTDDIVKAIYSWIEDRLSRLGNGQ